LGKKTQKLAHKILLAQEVIVRSKTVHFSEIMLHLMQHLATNASLGLGFLPAAKPRFAKTIIYPHSTVCSWLRYDLTSTKQPARDRETGFLSTSRTVPSSYVVPFLCSYWLSRC
jgi:hypothetical protein